MVQRGKQRTGTGFADVRVINPHLLQIGLAADGSNHHIDQRRWVGRMGENRNEVGRGVGVALDDA